jgi:hypothetical protein
MGSYTDTKGLWCRLAGYKARGYLKLNNVKRAGSVVQMVEHLPSKHAARSSTPSNAKKNDIRNVCRRNTHLPVCLLTLFHTNVGSKMEHP